MDNWKQRSLKEQARERARRAPEVRFKEAFKEVASEHKDTSDRVRSRARFLDQASSINSVLGVIVVGGVVVGGAAAGKTSAQVALVPHGSGAVNVNVDGGGGSGGYSGGGDGPEYVGGGDAGSVVSILGGGGRRRFRGGVGELVLQGGADEIDDVLVDDGPTDVVDVIGPDVIPANDPTLQGWGMPKLPCPTGTCRR